MAEVEQTIIIKKIKKVEGGHHGGAWKVAYADFVTAMMAFFLLLWLLSSTSEGQKDGIAEYFTPTVGLKDSMGIGFKGGESAATETGTKKTDEAPVGLIVGQAPQGPIAGQPKDNTSMEDSQDSKLFDKAEAEIKKVVDNDPTLADFRNQIVVQQTPEGLKIDVVDAEKKEMFVPGSTTISDAGKRVLTALGKVIEKMPNQISITGHTDASPYGKDNSYTNWELSADRANASRRYLLATGMTTGRVGKVVGRADQELFEPADPQSPKNRRIAIVLLRDSQFTAPVGFAPAPRSLLSVPKIDAGSPAPAIPEAPPPSSSPEPAAALEKAAPSAGKIPTTAKPFAPRH